jgi:hypothetical protein
VLVPSPESGVSDSLSWDSSRRALTTADIAAGALLARPYLPAPPSTSSPASTPAEALLPPLRSRGASLPITFRPHRFARSRRFAPPIAPLARDSAPSTEVVGAGLTGLLHPVADPGVRCVSGRRPGGSGTPPSPSRSTFAEKVVLVQPVTRTPLPRSAFRTLRRIPPIRSRIVSPRPLPPWCSLPSQPRSIQRDRYRLRRSCLDCVMHHLRGVAPPMGPYR